MSKTNSNNSKTTSPKSNLKDGFEDCQSQSSIVTQMPFKIELDGKTETDDSPFALDVTKTEEVKTTMKVRREKGTGKLRYVIRKTSSYSMDGTVSESQSSASSSGLSVAKMISEDQVIREFVPPEGVLTGSGQIKKKKRTGRKRPEKAQRQKEKFHEEGQQTFEEIKFTNLKTPSKQSTATSAKGTPDRPSFTRVTPKNASKNDSPKTLGVCVSSSNVALPKVTRSQIRTVPRPIEYQTQSPVSLSVKTAATPPSSMSNASDETPVMVTLLAGISPKSTTPKSGKYDSLKTTGVGEEKGTSFLISKTPKMASATLVPATLPSSPNSSFFSLPATLRNVDIHTPSPKAPPSSTTTSKSFGDAGSVKESKVTPVMSSAIGGRESPTLPTNYFKTSGKTPIVKDSAADVPPATSPSSLNSSSFALPKALKKVEIRTPSPRPVTSTDDNHQKGQQPSPAGSKAEELLPPSLYNTSVNMSIKTDASGGKEKENKYKSEGASLKSKEIEKMQTPSSAFLGSSGGKYSQKMVVVASTSLTSPGLSLVPAPATSSPTPVPSSSSARSPSPVSVPNPTPAPSLDQWEPDSEMENWTHVMTSSDEPNMIFKKPEVEKVLETDSNKLYDTPVTDKKVMEKESLPSVKSTPSKEPQSMMDLAKSSSSKLRRTQSKKPPSDEVLRIRSARDLVQLSKEELTFLEKNYYYKPLQEGKEGKVKEGHSVKTNQKVQKKIQSTEKSKSTKSNKSNQTLPSAGSPAPSTIITLQSSVTKLNKEAPTTTPAPFENAPTKESMKPPVAHNKSTTDLQRGAPEPVLLEQRAPSQLTGDPEVDEIVKQMNKALCTKKDAVEEDSLDDGYSDAVSIKSCHSGVIFKITSDNGQQQVEVKKEEVEVVKINKSPATGNAANQETVKEVVKSSPAPENSANQHQVALNSSNNSNSLDDDYSDAVSIKSCHSGVTFEITSDNGQQQVEVKKEEVKVVKNKSPEITESVSDQQIVREVVKSSPAPKNVSDQQVATEEIVKNNLPTASPANQPQVALKSSSNSSSTNLAAHLSFLERQEAFLAELCILTNISVPPSLSTNANATLKEQILRRQEELVKREKDFVAQLEAKKKKK